MTYATETMPPALVGQVQRRVGPPRRLRVSFACNDPENPGRVWAAQLESLYRVGKHPWDAELTHDDWGRGVAFTVDAPRMRLRLHRQWFAYKRCIPYFGNMMWDAFEFERGTGARLLDAMRRDGGWHCEAGPSSFYRWWNRRPNVAGNRIDPACRGNSG